MEKFLQKQSPSSASFRDYVFAENKAYLLIMAGILLIEFVIFKILYPFPDFFSDSYSYIRAAYLHLDVNDNTGPIGYSRFLALFHHWVSHSGSALIAFQYMAWCCSALYFYFTVTYFYPTGKNTRIFLNLFLFFNPLIFYTTNYVTSDILFISMSTVLAISDALDSEQACISAGTHPSPPYVRTIHVSLQRHDLSPHRRWLNTAVPT